MNIIQDLLVCERIRCGSPVASKKRALEVLSELLATGQTGLSARTIFDSLFSRERLGSTGLGHGVALPHGRCGQQEHAVGAFITVDGNGIDFNAIDGAPVRLIFGLLVPEHYTDEHLKILAYLAEMFSDTTLRAALLACDDPFLTFDFLCRHRPRPAFPL